MLDRNVHILCVHMVSSLYTPTMYKELTHRVKREIRNSTSRMYKRFEAGAAVRGKITKIIWRGTRTQQLARASIFRTPTADRASACPAAPLAAALAALLLGGVGVGRAQTAVSLIEVEGGGTSIGFDGERALGIATAASAGTGNDGWLVTEVELRIRPDDGTGTDRTATPPGLAICESDADGDPDGTCYPLIAPGAVEIPVATTTGQEVAYATPGSGTSSQLELTTRCISQRTAAPIPAVFITWMRRVTTVRLRT